MDVAVTAPRAGLSGWIDRALSGEEVVITDRGIPVARLVLIAAAPLIEDLVAEGVIAPPVRPTRPRARGADRVRASGPVADLVNEHRG